MGISILFLGAVAGIIALVVLLGLGIWFLLKNSRDGTSP
jgi:hypothetical protein